MAKINKTLYALLGLLDMRGPSTGYELKAFIDESLSFFWQENYGHIYPVLKKIKEKGFALCQVVPSEGKPPRKVYTITEEGLKELKIWLQSPLESISIKSELLLRIFFTGPGNTTEVLKMLKNEEEANRNLLLQYESIEKHIHNCHDKSKNILLTLKYGQHFSQGVLNWCSEARTILEEEK